MLRLYTSNAVSVLLIAFLLSACAFQNKHTALAGDIIGNWKQDRYHINYTQLTFSDDSNAVFTSHGDTVYRFKFYIKYDDLILKDMFDSGFKAKILKLDKDSLVFETLLENNEVQRYSRNK